MDYAVDFWIELWPSSVVERTHRSEGASACAGSLQTIRRTQIAICGLVIIFSGLITCRVAAFIVASKDSEKFRKQGCRPSRTNNPALLFNILRSDCSCTPSQFDFMFCHQLIYHFSFADKCRFILFVNFRSTFTTWQDQLRYHAQL